MTEAYSNRRSICVYCGSRFGASDAYRGAAQALGEAIGETGWRLVYGGAQAGLMGVLADSALAAGAEVVGVIPCTLIDRELAHRGLTELRIVESMHARKLAMVEVADAFAVLPGGFGTLDELFEVLTWHQLGWHDKPCGLLDVDGFYQPLMACLRHMRDAGFVTAHHVERIALTDDPAQLLVALGES
jgi:uncharacterized protein (TIGR00730 family)